MLWDYTLQYIRILDERRRKRLDALASPEDVEALNAETRKRLLEMWGPLPPEKTPLNVQQAGELDRGDYVIEKLVFESRPQLYVTANLYRPKIVEGKLPAVVVPCGHMAEGKAGDTYQRFAVLLARHGFLALVYDPVGQGERLQFWDGEKQASVVGPGTREHRPLGHQCWWLGLNLMQYRAWDTHRAIDYLVSRPDVDAGRIGLGGNSGGGMETLQYLAFDDRVQAAFPSCAVATFKAKTEALLIADPEQVLVGALRYGVDHPELLAAFAPRPLIIGSATEDYVPIEAARRTFAEVQRVYRILGSEHLVAQAETEAGHGLHSELRVAAVDWFSRWLSPTSRRVIEEPAEVATAEELRCTATGQVAESLGGKTVVDLNMERLVAVAPRRQPPRTLSAFSAYKNDIQHRIKAVTRVGAFRPEHGIFVPDRMLEPVSHSRGVVMVIADAGKDDSYVRRAVIDPILAADYRVLGVDLRGWGESKPVSGEGVSVSFDWEDFFAYRALEIGKPLIGQRMKDVLALGPTRTHATSWSLVGVGPSAAIVAAHCAALDLRISRLITVNAPVSFRSLVEHPLHRFPVAACLPGVISEYDMRDLYAAGAPRPTLALNPLGPAGEPVHEVRAWEEYDWASRTFEALGADGRLEVRSELNVQDLRQTITGWLKKS